MTTVLAQYFATTQQGDEPMGTVDVSKMDIEVLRKIVSQVQSPAPVTYHQIDGVQCPLCKARHRGREMGIYKTEPWAKTTRTRYHTCPECGYRFKSVELLGAA